MQVICLTPQRRERDTAWHLMDALRTEILSEILLTKMADLTLMGNIKQTQTEECSMK